MTESEHHHQCAFIQWCDFSKVPVYSNANGIYLPVPNFFPIKYQAMLKKIVLKVISKMKKEGAFRVGIPDLTIPVKNEKFGALYIEMKIKGNSPTKEQKSYMKMLEKYGNKCVVCYGVNEAIIETTKYLNNE